jgi:hypothetical protein
MRATTAFNRIIAIDGVIVEEVTFTPEGVVVRIRRRKRSHLALPPNSGHTFMLPESVGVRIVTPTRSVTCC